MSHYIEEISSPERLQAALHAVLDGAVCRAARLGGGGALLLTFSHTGEDVYDLGHKLPRYDISTYLSTWYVDRGDELVRSAETIEGGISPPASDWPSALENESVVSWGVSEVDWALSISFTSNLRVDLVPWTAADCLEYDQSGDAWVVKQLESYYGVTNDGRVTMQRAGVNTAMF